MNTAVLIRRIMACMLALVILFNYEAASTYAYSEKEITHTLESEEIQNIILESMKGNQSPGAAITVANGERIIHEEYGSSNVRKKTPITTDTLFELGSTTKAFTALAMLILDDEGVISLEDRVSKYVPWFNVNYKGKHVEITIEQVIHHSSGLPEKTINQFPEGTSHDLLEKTVRLTDGITLNFYPGTDFEYANIGYDLLAYILEMVTKKKYEDFVEEKILLPLGMHSSYYDLDEAKKTGNMARGYSPFFNRSIEYDAPRYQGSLADGYLITSAKDMGIWLNAQLGRGNFSEQLGRLIKKSHTINNDIVVGEFEGKPLYYSYGWIVSEDGAYITHSGENPSFTSNIIILPKKEIAIGVQSNSPGSQTIHISQNIMKHLNDEPLVDVTYGQALLDKICSIGIIALATLIFLAIVLIGTMKKRIHLKKRVCLKKEKFLLGVKLLIGLSFMVILAVWPYLIDYSLHMVLVWMPLTLIILNVLCFVWMILFVISSIMRFQLIKSIALKN